MTKDIGIAVVGGGVVGMAVAYGLVRTGHDVTVFDEEDTALRASRGNFGLVWVQSKGSNLTDYARWTRLSAKLWPEFAREIEAASGCPAELHQPGGLMLALDENELDENKRVLDKLRQDFAGDYPYERLGHNAVREMLPEIGPRVVGATYFPEDGHVNPLALLRSLYAAYLARGGQVEHGGTVDELVPVADGFRIRTAKGEWRSQRALLCAGHGNARLAPMVGLAAPISPQRGQVMVTERLRAFMNYPTVTVRQMGSGAVQIGDSHEDAGFDDRTTPDVTSAIARRAIDMFPMLEHVRMVRTWGALRVLSPDGCPIYDLSDSCPGAAVVNCHSGITLAAVHALVLAPWLGGGERPDHVESLSARRFDLQAAH